MGRYTCATCGAREDSDDIGECSVCGKWVCSACWTDCEAVGCGLPTCCPSCAVAVLARQWSCCGQSSEARTFHPNCVPDAEDEQEEHGCVACDACGDLTCPAAPACLSCVAAAEVAAQAPLRAADVRVARDALAAAKSDSLRTLLQGWLDKHADAEDAAGSAGAKKRKA